MGTRAAFFIGDFRDPDSREWLGCIAFDGYPDGVPEIVAAKSEADFRAAVIDYSKRDDFAPATGPFPYPWTDDLCLTDEVYCWHDGEVWCECARRFVPLKRYAAIETEEDYDALKADYPTVDCNGIPAPGAPYDGSAPDSIMIFSA